MKRSHVCPKCGGRRIWVIERVQAVEVFGKYGGRRALVDVGLTASTVTTQGVLFDGTSSENVGTVECWACDGCGYVEYYAHDMENLAELADDPDSGVRLIDGNPPGRGPHRSGERSGAG